ncbi:MAG: hypothetical protein J07HX5_01712, partial [halophilic archaeon J07HX5]
MPAGSCIIYYLSATVHDDKPARLILLDAT